MDTTNLIETSYSATVSFEHRKKYAQFFTPADIAAIMAKWLLGNKKLQNVLEPAFGLGIFSRILLSQKKELSITGYDIDQTINAEAWKLFGNLYDLSLYANDYMESAWDKKYDGIICNPPYFKFQDYDNHAIVSLTNNKLKISLNLKSNLYTLFLLKSISQLKPGGRCAYLIPSEFMNSDYGLKIKEVLLQSGRLRHIIVFGFNISIFNDALTTSAIILCANDNHKSHITFTHIDRASDLSKINELISSYPHNTHCDLYNTYKIREIKPEIKWKNYYAPTKLPKIENLIPFSRYAKVMRGIATGANDYFTFTRNKAVSNGIKSEYLKPCICHCVDVKNLCFTEKDFEALARDNRSVYLLNINTISCTKIAEYIKKGISEKINERFLTSKRNPWFSMGKREPAPIWVTVFNRNGLRFVRNETTALNLTTFHCIYLKDNQDGVDADLLFAYLISNTAKKLFSKQSREYGNGLSKFEPNDLNKSMIPDIGKLPDNEKERLRTIYRQNKKNTDKSFINEIDSILIRFFNI